MNYVGKASLVTTGQGVEVPYLDDCNTYIVKTKKDKELRAAEYADCVVVALAHALEISYSKAHSYCKEFFNRENGKGTLDFYKIRLATSAKYRSIADKYFPTKKVDEIDTGKLYRNRCKWSGEMRFVERNMTLKTFLKYYPKGRYVLGFTDHAIAVIDGVVVGNAGISDAIRLRRPVYFAVQVTNN